MTITKAAYRAYIGSGPWLRRRAEFLQCHPECNRCGLSRENATKVYDQDLNVHHRDYSRIGYELDSDLEALCRRCHEVETFGKSDLPIVTPHLDQQRWADALARDRAHITEDGIVGVF
jgi:5-methylcytosine-specific restriction endonuclease McrA